MTNNKIYVMTVQGQRRYFAENPVYSDISGEPISLRGWLLSFWSRQGFGHKVFVCTDEEALLIKKHDQSIDPTFDPSLYDSRSINSLNVGIKIPPGAISWVPQPPTLKTAKNLDIFSVADRQVGDEVVKDKTVHSRKLSSKNASDYDSLEHRDQVLLDLDQKTELASDNPDYVLTELQSAGSQAHIEHKKTNLVENQGVEEE